MIQQFCFSCPVDWHRARGPCHLDMGGVAQTPRISTSEVSGISPIRCMAALDLDSTSTPASGTSKPSPPLNTWSHIAGCGAHTHGRRTLRALQTAPSGRFAPDAHQSGRMSTAHIHGGAVPVFVFHLLRTDPCPRGRTPQQEVLRLVYSEKSALALRPEAFRSLLD